MSFAPGSSVRVASRSHAGHHRTPAYLKGKVGTVEHVRDSFLNPETRAYGGDGRPETRLYLVRFDQRHVWTDYEGPEDDGLLADVYEHWLESAE